jgi:hypothetical protein
MKFKKSAELTKLSNSEPISFMKIIQQEQAIKAYRFSIYDRTIHCHMYMEKVITDVDGGLTWLNHSIPGAQMYVFT